MKNGEFLNLDSENTEKGNFDLETDAGSLPSPRLPVILIPGVGGSQLINDPNLDGIYDQVWLNIFMLTLSDGDEHLYPADLQWDGNTPDNPAGAEYYTMRAGISCAPN